MKIDLNFTKYLIDVSTEFYYGLVEKGLTSNHPTAHSYIQGIEIDDRIDRHQYEFPVPIKYCYRLQTHHIPTFINDNNIFNYRDSNKTVDILKFEVVKARQRGVTYSINIGYRLK